MTYVETILLGALQGFTELFPISSLGHSVLLPSLLHWNIDQHDPAFLVFLVATHLATAVVLFFFFLPDWVSIIKGFFRVVFRMKIGVGDTYARLAVLIVLATIPAGLLGLLFQKKLEALFAAPLAVAGFLALNGILFIGTELWAKKKGKADSLQGAHDDGAIAALTFWKAIRIGCMQCLALLPGFSRTGATISGGIFSNLSRADAARFSFLLATPIIGAAAVLKLPSLILHPVAFPVGPIVLGTIAAALAAYLSVRFLMKYFTTNTLMPFGIYCLLAGVVSGGMLLFF